jgi:hypothetical protein
VEKMRTDTEDLHLLTAGDNVAKNRDRIIFKTLILKPNDK